MLLGYYVGYKKTVHGDDKPYLFETVEFIKEQGHEHQLQISNLEVFTEYAVVVQAFNKIGQGKQNSVRKSSWPQNSHNVSRIMVGILIKMAVFYRICCGLSGFQQETDANFVFLIIASSMLKIARIVASTKN